MTLKELYKIIKDRRGKMPVGSYVASLFKQGEDRIIQKVGEEAVEVVIAAKNKVRKRVVSEVADLFFHVLILMSNFDINIKDIENELQRRTK